MADPSRSALARHAPSHRVRAAYRRRNEYLDFLSLHEMVESPSGVLLFLTSLMGAQERDGSALRRALSELDLAAACEGLPPPSKQAEVRRYIRGMHKGAPIGPAIPRSEPLYKENVRALLHMVRQPSARQLRDIAFLLIINQSGARQGSIQGLRWSNVRLRRTSAQVDLRVPSGGSLRFTFEASDDRRISIPHVLRALRSEDGPGDGPIVAQRGDKAGKGRYTQLLRSIGATDRHPHALGVPWVDPQRLSAAVDPLWGPPTASVRDEALILLSYLAALTNREASDLAVGDVQSTQRGLLLHLRHRSVPVVGLPRSADSAICPAQSWERWIAIYGPDDDDPAFPRLRPMGYRITRDRLSETALSEILQTYCGRAGLHGQYAFTSLRTGFIRTAIRDNVPHHVIALHTGLKQFRTIDHQADRESILSNNVAARVGL